MIQSPVQKIRELGFYRLPAGKPINVKKAVRVDGRTFIVGENNKIYCNSIADRAYYPISHFSFCGPLVKALSRLGIITKAEAKKHIDACDAADHWREMQSEINHFRKGAERLGIVFSDQQKKKLKKLMPENVK